VERLPHPDSGVEDLAIVMELLEGIDLARFTETLTLSKAKMFAEQLASGLQAIHDQGLIHDDIHSGNVLLTNSGAKLLDIAYTQTLAGAGPSTRVRSYREDTRDFVRVVRELLERVPELDRKLAVECHFQAERGAQSPAQVLQFFARVWDANPTDSDAIAMRLRAGRVFLLACRTERDGADYSTHVLVDGELVRSLPYFAMHCEGELLTMQKRTREIFILRQLVYDRWHESVDEPSPSDYERKSIFSPWLLASDGSRSLEIATPEPTGGSYETLFSYDRGVYITGFMGPYLFVEQLDYRFGGGAHPDSSRIHYVIDVRSGLRPIEIFSQSEREGIMAREGLVAKEAFVRLRDGDPRPSEVTVELAASYPVFAQDSVARLRLVFTTFTTYVESEPRWSSYSLAEEVSARRLPELLKDHEHIPAEVVTAMRTIPGYLLGWSEIQPGEAGMDGLIGAIAAASGLTSNTGSLRSVGTILNQHNGATPWRSGYHALSDDDIAKEVGAALSQVSRTKEDALARLSGQLQAELVAAARRLDESEFLSIRSSAASIIEDFFARLPPKQP